MSEHGNLRSRGFSVFLVVAMAVLVTSPAPGPAHATGSICELPEQERPTELVEPMELCGTTTITASGEPAMARVRLDRDAVMSADGAPWAHFGGGDDEPFHMDNPDVDIEGAGRITGVALVEPGLGGVLDRSMLVALGFRMCDQPGCTTEEGSYEYVAGFLDVAAGRYTIPQGEYLLYVITDGAPVSVRLDLHGLGGDAELDLTGYGDPDVTVGVPPDSLSEPTTRAAHSRGESFQLQGEEALVFLALRVRGESWVTGRYGVCLYEGEPIIPPPAAYTYPCPGGFGVFINDATPTSGPFQKLIHPAVHVMKQGGGAYSWGGGYVAAAGVDRSDHVQLHIVLPPEVTTADAAAGPACSVAGAHADGLPISCDSLIEMSPASSHLE